jgi:8-oxo-dGTP diphosphatase
MVRHRRTDGSEYWQLPGGGAEVGETMEATALRELWEETGLRGQIVRHLFTIPYRLGLSTTFLVDVDPSAVPVLGIDPEEVSMGHRKLVGIAWVPLDEVRENTEVRQLMLALEQTGL